MVQLIDNKAYLHKEVVIGLGLTTDRYLRNGKKKPAHWDIRVAPDNGKKLLIGYEALPDLYKDVVVSNIGNPYELVVRHPIMDAIQLSKAAYQYFSAYTYNGGNKLPYKRILQYSRAEAILTFIINNASIRNIRNQFGVDAVTFYEHLTALVEQEKKAGANDDYEGPNQLDGKFPSSYCKLLARARDYKAAGDYSFLIPSSYGNTKALKVTTETEQLLNNIYIQHSKPNYKEVHNIYSDFVAGKIGIANEDTGEPYEPANFAAISLSTVYGYVSAWENRSVTHKKRSNDKIGYNQAYRPYASLEAPHYAGSLISMDDRDLPFKTPTGTRVKAYLAMDVASEYFVAYSFAVTHKDMGLVMNCFENLYNNLLNWGYHQPAEVEVEQHLMSTLKEGLLKDGNVFPYVRFAQAANPQEKTIERAFRRMRYGIDKNAKSWIPRPFARNEANQGRTEEDINTVNTAEEVMELAAENIHWWNSQPHPNQKKYRGLTREQVWHQCQNGNLLPIEWPKVARWIGRYTESSINRGEIRAYNDLYVLPKMADTALLGNGKDLQLYALPTADGDIHAVHVYKNEEYILSATKKLRWQKARIEQTPADREKMAIQQSYTAAFDADVKRKKNALQQVVIYDNAQINEAIATPVTIIDDLPALPLQEPCAPQDYAANAIDNL